MSNKIKNKFLNILNKKGKKEKAEKLFKKSCKLTQKNYLKNFNEIIKSAITNLSPIANVGFISIKKRRKVKKKEKTYILKPNKRIFFSITTIIKSAKKKSPELFYKKLSNELIVSSKILSLNAKKKILLHRQAFKKKFSNFKWF